MDSENQNSSHSDLNQPPPKQSEDQIKINLGIVSIVLSAIILIGLFSGFVYIISTYDSSEFLAGLGVVYVWFIAFVLFIANIIIYIISRKWSKFDPTQHKLRKTGGLLLIAIPIFFFAQIPISGAVYDYLGRKEAAREDKLTEVHRASNDRYEIEAAKETKAAEAKEITLLQKYGFYYLTDDTSKIVELKVESDFLANQPDYIRLSLIHKNGSFDFNNNRYLPPIFPNLNQYSFKDKTAFTDFPCYHEGLGNKVDCQNTSGQFSGHPIKKAVRADSDQPWAPYRYFITSGTVLIAYNAASDEEAQDVANRLRPIDETVGRTFVQNAEGIDVHSSFY